MCGFGGFLGGREIPACDWSNTLVQMGQAIAHRGSDDAGVWMDLEANIALVHQRLSILDLSPAGHQPMESVSGRYLIAFNGEIYNHLDLRSELEVVGAIAAASGWRGHSDTETLLGCIEHWGVDSTLRNVVGMFAFAVWDRRSRKLILARDRLGEKPLYYGWQGGTFLFGSELKSLRAYPAFNGDVDRSAVALFLRHNYIPTPYTIYRGIRKLTPGCFLEIHLGEGQALSEPKPYWSLVDVVSEGRANPFLGDEREAVDALDDLLKKAVCDQMMADVPVGSFLSGGIDSSIVLALMQSQSARPVKTFTIGFHESGYNEAEHAKAVARHLGAEHTEVYVSPKQALDVIPRLPALYDEPFADSSQIPTFLVSEIARRNVTVSLSGDAGDELFGGYERYSSTAAIWQWFARAPKLCHASMAFARALSPKSWDRIATPITRFLPIKMRNIGHKLHKFAELVESTSRMDFYRQFVSNWASPEDVVLGGSEPNIFFARTHGEQRDIEFVESMMLTDALTYLPDDILVKVDRAAMGVSLETRIPFLDHRVVEFAWRLPLSLKVRHGETKWILRQILDKYIPRELIERPKMGFGVPIDSWLRGPLRDWAESLLDESRLSREGFFNPEPIRKKWAEHLSGQRNWQYHIWDVLMFQAWLEQEQLG